MKRIIWAVFLLTAIAAAASSQVDEKPKIKSIRTTTYEAVQEDSLWKAGAVVSNVIYERFNPAGDKIAEYKLDGESRVKSKKIYTYDEAGKLVEAATYNKDARLISKTTYEYGENGKRSKLTMLLSSTGLPSEQVTTFTYDDKQRVVLSKKAVNNGLMETRSYQYDEKENTEECIIKASTGALIGRLINKYDGKGNVIRSQSYGTRPEQNMVVTYEYDFDAFGNWVRKTELINGEKDLIVQRVIDYGLGDTDWQRLSLKGKVKSVSQTSYVAIPRGEEILRGKKQGSFVDYLFDEEGRIISETSYSETGVAQHTVKKEYNEEGRLAKETCFSPDGRQKWYAVYKYGKDKTLKAKTVYNADNTPKNKTVYRYDAEGNLTQELTYDRDGKLYLQYDNLYNAYGQLVQRSSPVHPSEDALYNKVVRLYNFQGRVELESVYSPSDSLLLNRSYKYASSGRIVSGTECVPGTPVVEYTYKFYNDERGNWKKRIKFVDGKPLVYEERTYTYYGK